MSDVHADTVGALLDARVRSTPSAVACSVREGNSWREITWSQVAARVAAAQAQLARLGVTHGSRVALMAPNSLEWDVVHWAALRLGAVVVGLDAGERDENLQAMMALVEPSVVIAATVATAARLQRTTRPLITFLEQHPVRAEGAPVEALATAGGDASVPPREVSPTDIATIVFTSGTTGTPKGIAYSHRQLALAVRSILAALPEIASGDRLPCWLPQAHLFQRIINLCALTRGAHVFYVEKPLELATLLPSIAPHVLIGVPRFFEKTWAGITAAVRKQPWPLRHVGDWAVKVGRRHASEQRNGRHPSALLQWQSTMANKLVLTSIRKALGGQLRYLISGAAPLPSWLLEAFHGVGLLVLEAYGLSENVIPTCMNTASAFRFGTVGRPLGSTQLRISDEGEVQVRGDGVFTGYLGAPTENLEGDGWLSTGDLGELDADGFLRIVGRKSEVVKTSTGRKVALPAIEALLRKLPWVDLPVAVALGRSHPLAMLYVNVPSSTLTQQVPALRRELQTVCSELSPHERPAGCVFIPRAPSLDAGELTANLKVRRAVIEARFAPALAALSNGVEQHVTVTAWQDDVLVATT